MDFRRKIFLIFMVLALFPNIKVASANTVIDQEWTGPIGAGYVVYSSQSLAESITIQNSGILSQIDLEIGRVYNSLDADILTINVETLSNGLPSGNSLLTTTISASALSYTNQWVSFDVSPSQLHVASNDTYAIVLNNSAGHFSQGFSWSGSSSDAYPDETGYSTSTGSWQDANVDFAFRTYVETPAVPEPVSSTLFIFGGAVMGFRRFGKKRCHMGDAK